MGKDVNIKVSVIIPMLNSRQYIQECLESVINQTLKEIEVICVDAGSTDGTLEILADFAQKDKRIRVIDSNKKSYGHQVNLGIEAAYGEYIGIVESDDYIAPNMYESFYKIAKKYNLDAIKSDHKNFIDECGKRKYIERPLITNKRYYNTLLNPSQEPDLLRANNINPPGLYSAKFLNEKKVRLNETPGASYQDNGFWFQVFTQATRMYFLQEPFYMVRRDNPNSSVKSRQKVYSMCDEYDFIHDFLKNKGLLKRFGPYCALHRFHNYIFTLNRIDDSYKREFALRFSRDFIKIKNNNELDKHLFSENQWNTLTEIMEDPDKYYFIKLYQADNSSIADSKTSNVVVLQKKVWELNHQLNVMQKEIESIHKSKTYRIGRFMTWLPRKGRGFIRCYKEHGMSYTYNRTLVHLHLKADKENSFDILEQGSKEIKRDYHFYESLPISQYRKELEAWYEKTVKEPLNLDNPQTFNEKMQWLKLYDSTPLKTRLADKYLVRDWIKEKIGEQYLVPLLGVWDCFDDIDFDKLPNSFVLKANHGSGWNIIVKDKTKFDTESAKKKFNIWMHKNYAFQAGLELHYMNIPPKILAEKYIEEFDQVYDYKFMCFDGKVKFIWVDTDRFTNHHRTLFTANWERMNVTIGYPRPNYEIPKPEKLDEMLNLATVLAQGFAHVRVDFYYVKGTIYFGEMTFTSESGTTRATPRAFERQMGDWIVLPPKSPIPERKVF